MTPLNKLQPKRKNFHLIVTTFSLLRYKKSNKNGNEENRLTLPSSRLLEVDMESMPSTLKMISGKSSNSSILRWGCKTKKRKAKKRSL